MCVRLVRSVAVDLNAVLFEAEPCRIDLAMRPTPKAWVQRWVSERGVSPWLLRVLMSPYVIHPVVRGLAMGDSDEQLHRLALKLERHRRKRYQSKRARLLRFSAIQRLIDSMVRDGFCPPHKASGNPDAIGVVVRDDGGLTWLRQGDHRLSLAKALDLPYCIIRIWAFEPRFVIRALREHPQDSVRASVLVSLEGHGIRPSRE